MSPNEPTIRDDVAEDVEAAEESEATGECQSLVPLYSPRRFPHSGARIMAALCYFCWLGYIAAPLPLLLLRLRSLRRWKRFAGHAYAAAAWSILVASLQLVIMTAAIILRLLPTPTAEAAANTLELTRLVIVLTFATLLSCYWGLEALLGRDINIPLIGPWAQRKARDLEQA